MAERWKDRSFLRQIEAGLEGGARIATGPVGPVEMTGT